MADLQYVTRNNLTLQVQHNRRSVDKAFLIAGLPIAGVATYLAPHLSPVWLGVWGFGYFTSRYSDRNAIMEVGASGENKTLKALSNLPDDYLIFNQVRLPDERSRTGYSEADFIVVGPNGLFVVESKDYNGYLKGNDEDRDWTLIKTGQSGASYSTSVRNPVRQAKKYVILLKNALERHNVNVWITPLVSLTKTDRNDGISSRLIITSPSGLPAFIAGSKGRFEEEARQQATRAITNLVKYPVR
jgi:hypothetical protein